MANANASAASQSTVFPRSHVGFDSITSQIEKKLLKRGFQFNVMCVGRSSAAFLGLILSNFMVPTSYSQDKPAWANRP
jgi:septin 3/9/12